MDQNRRHKYADLIIAWANGAEIETTDTLGKWFVTENPSWNENVNYRIKGAFRELKEAFEQGKIIQWEISDGKWVDTCSPLWDENIKYRVKPIQEYIPFEWEDRDKLKRKWLKSKTEKHEFQIKSFRSNKYDFLINEYSSEFLFENYTFFNGTPFGKLKF